MNRAGGVAGAPPWGVRTVQDVWSTHEAWVYECVHCEHIWNEQFEVRHSDDGHSHDGVAYERHGQRCMTPWSDHVCPRCGAQNVKAVAGAFGRHPIVPEARRGNELELVFRLRRLHAW
ncbi:hypothetical protein [Spirillospora albida]|uniref:hypothetical protein n=1 Tax=Spirillospora albida TaxID=58123 RepID=UPI0012F788D4|nr:hypothetical protein [Spirillospora albida]